MAGNLLDLAKRLEKLADDLPEQVSEQSKKAAIAIVTDLANKTPVDTSNALSNWQVTLDSPATSEIPPHFPGSGGNTQRASVAQTIANAIKVLESKKPGQKIYITNNAPYIRRLNDGYSAQQPAGFVERAALIGRVVLRKFKVKHGR